MHVQLNQDGLFLRKVPSDDLIEWDANNYCTAFALEKDGKADQFRIKPFYTTGEPAHDPITQGVREIDPAPVNGNWTQQWEVVALDAETVAANQAAKLQALQASIVQSTQQRLDDFAKTRNYDGILSACTYASSTVPKFQAEGQYCVNARDNTWATLYAILGEVQAGTRPVPSSYADIAGDLPTLTWPV